MKKKLLILLSIVPLIFLIGCSDDSRSTNTETSDSSAIDSSQNGTKQNEDTNQVQASKFNGVIKHVHGMGYAGNNNRVYVGSHVGLKFYTNGNWYEVSENQNDYMGFSAVNQGFYTSGHPNAVSDLPNPIGIQKSFDGGKTLESIGFVGESDFHNMAVGYNSHDIFLYNPQKNSTLGKGFYISRDEGKTWNEVAASGIDGELFGIALHPTNSNLVAASTVGGVYLSKDGGESFELLTDRAQGIGVHFSEDQLYYSTYKTEASLVAYDWTSQEKVRKNLPELGKDAPLYIAQNPQNKDTFVFFTLNGQAYKSEDDTKSWKQIVKDGRVQ